MPFGVVPARPGSREVGGETGEEVDALRGRACSLATVDGCRVLGAGGRRVTRGLGCGLGSTHLGL